MDCVGYVWVCLNADGCTEIFKIYVVKGNIPALLGRDWWLRGIKLNWAIIIQDRLNLHNVCVNTNTMQLEYAATINKCKIEGR